jgi:hypothetical protein
MANAVVTGLLVATFLTLIAVPAMYRLSDTISDLLDKAWRHMVGKIFFTILGAGAMLAFLKVLFS